MSGFINFAAGSPTNLDTTNETIGLTAGVPTQITAGGASHVKGTPADIGSGTSAGSAWKGFWVLVGQADATNQRFFIDIYLNGSGGAATVPNLYVNPGTTGGPRAYWFQMAVTPGSAANSIQAACQCQTASAKVRVYIIGVLSTATSAPLYTNIELMLAADTTNTRPSATTVALDDTAYGLLTASSGHTYGATMGIVGQSSNATTAGTQNIGLSLATGAALSEVPYFSWSVYYGAASPVIAASASQAINKSIPSGTRISMKGVSVTTTDTLYINAYGFW